MNEGGASHKKTNERKGTWIEKLERNKESKIFNFCDNNETELKLFFSSSAESRRRKEEKTVEVIKISQTRYEWNNYSHKLNKQERARERGEREERGAIRPGQKNVSSVEKVRRASAPPADASFDDDVNDTDGDIESNPGPERWQEVGSSSDVVDDNDADDGNGGAASEEFRHQELLIDQLRESGGDLPRRELGLLGGLRQKVGPGFLLQLLIEH